MSSPDSFNLNSVPPVPIAAEPVATQPASSTATRFTRHVAATVAVRLLMLSTSVGAGVIVARVLGPEGVGALAVISVSVATVVQLGNAGLPSANIYFIARDRRTLAPALANSLIFALVMGGVLALVMALAAQWEPR